MLRLLKLLKWNRDGKRMYRAYRRARSAACVKLVQDLGSPLGLAVFSVLFCEPETFAAVSDVSSVLRDQRNKVDAEVTKIMSSPSDLRELVSQSLIVLLSLNAGKGDKESALKIVNSKVFAWGASSPVQNAREYERQVWAFQKRYGLEKLPDGL